jgi:hypothetical protein
VSTNDRSAQAKVYRLTARGACTLDPVKSVSDTALVDQVLKHGFRLHRKKDRAAFKFKLVAVTGEATWPVTREGGSNTSHGRATDVSETDK